MATLAVHVSPKSSRDEILGWSMQQDAPAVGFSGAKTELMVKLTAAPTDGKANEALIKLLARELGVPKSYISVKNGHTSRHKLLHIEMEQEVLDTALKK